MLAMFMPIGGSGGLGLEMLGFNIEFKVYFHNTLPNFYSYGSPIQ